jgi:phosphate transport system substrate-binding protein
MRNFRSLRAAAVFFILLTAGCGSGGSQAHGRLGGNGAGAFDASREIGVITREDGSGTRDAFIELFDVVVKNGGSFRKDRTTKEAVIANMTGIMLTHVAEDPHAIGYVSMGSLSGAVKTLNIDGAEAAPVNVKNGSYKIFRPFNIVTKGEPSDLAQDFIDFILSEEGQAVVSEGYIAADAAAPAYSGGRPPGRIVVAGSSSMTPVMEKLKETYYTVNSEAHIEIQMSDSTSGINGAIEGTCDIGMAGRELKDTEKQALREVCIALDGIAVIVHEDNPHSGMTSEQVRQIYTGAFVTWNQVQSNGEI